MTQLPHKWARTFARILWFPSVPAATCTDAERAARASCKRASLPRPAWPGIVSSSQNTSAEGGLQWVAQGRRPWSRPTVFLSTWHPRVCFFYYWPLRSGHAHPARECLTPDGGPVTINKPSPLFPAWISYVLLTITRKHRAALVIRPRKRKGKPWEPSSSHHPSWKPAERPLLDLHQAPSAPVISVYSSWSKSKQRKRIYHMIDKLINCALFFVFYL